MSRCWNAVLCDSCKIAEFVSYAAKGNHNNIKRLCIRLAGTTVAFNSNTDHGLSHLCLIGHVSLSLEVMRMHLTPPPQSVTVLHLNLGRCKRPAVHHTLELENILRTSVQREGGGGEGEGTISFL